MSKDGAHQALPAGAQPSVPRNEPDSIESAWRSSFCAYIEALRSAIPDLVRHAEGSLEFPELTVTQSVGMFKKRLVDKLERYVGWPLASWTETNGEGQADVQTYLLHDGRILQIATIPGKTPQGRPVTDACFVDHFASPAAGRDQAQLGQNVDHLFGLAGLAPPAAPVPFPPPR